MIIKIVHFTWLSDNITTCTDKIIAGRDNFSLDKFKNKSRENNCLNEIFGNELILPKCTERCSFLFCVSQHRLFQSNSSQALIRPWTL